MSCGLRNECKQEYCHRCELGEDGRTMFVQSEKYASGYVDGFNNGYENVRADAIDEFKDLGKLYSEIRADAIDEFVKTIEKESVILYSWQGQDGIDYECVKMQDIYIKAKQLKEQRND